MSKREWTDAQKCAITTKYLTNGQSCNVLVGAAAGSGKTAVLVERVIKKLIPDDITSSIDIDKLLIVTFTNAAAREMEERIHNALSAELEKAISSGDEQRRRVIKRQQLLLSVSDITTIDAFCLKFLRTHFNEAGIEPDFSVADEAQAQLLSDEATEELFSDLYDKGDADFINLLHLYGSGRSDDGLAKLIHSIYGFMCSIPDPIERLYEMAEELRLDSGIQNTPWFKKGLEQFRADIGLALSHTKKGLEYMCGTEVDDMLLSDSPPEKGTPVYDEWKNYYNAFYNDFSVLKNLAEADFDSAKQILAGFSFTRLSRLDSKTDEEKDYLKRLRDKVKKVIEAAKAFTDMGLGETEEQSRNFLYPTALALARLTEQYHLRYTEKKNKRNILEFHDIEQLTASVLKNYPEAAEELQAKYDEILMDEYQDTSLLQEAIFSRITNGENLFMVGDMKQSIYRFRSSDPTIFKKKSDFYTDIPNSENRKIILSQNFRSRAEVLDSVNDIFEAVMSETAGELDYDSEQRLYCGNTDYTDTGCDYTSECCVIEIPPDDADLGEELSRQETEARFIAAEINRLKAEHFKIYDGKKVRDIENRDIVILMSSIRTDADAYISELNKAGIEAFAESSGYFERNEIKLMLSLFKVINNPHCDIPLIGILRSPVCGFTDDELVIIRKCGRGSFYSALKELISRNNTGALCNSDEINAAEKAAEFAEKLSRWRRLAKYLSADRLVWTLLEETDLYAFAGALHGGEEAQANLRLLFERAKQYEAGGFQGLFNFVKYLERIKKKNTDLSTATLVGEGHNVVRIMTIHKSKGLEFPVVFITGGGKKFNKRSDENRVMLHKDYGIAMDYIDFDNGYSAPTPAKAVFKRVSGCEQMSEEIRKLYVAATRAKEKLYFTAAVSGKPSKDNRPGLDVALEKWRSYTDNSKPTLSPADVLSSSCFADWAVPVAMTSKNWKTRFVRYFDLEKTDAVSETAAKNEPEEEIDAVRLLSFKYPYSEASELPTKVSVSELNADKSTVLRPVPRFMQEQAQDGAFYGNSVHKVMERLVPIPNMDEEYIASVLRELTAAKAMTQEEAALIRPEKILAFYSSSIGKRIAATEHVHREQPFEVQVPAKYIFPELENAENEMILLQGIIDCYFEEDGELVLVDYKTDRYADISEIHDKYDKQLELYSYALNKITKKRVKEKYFYLFFDNNIV